jgi:ketosteroid isomerase-like protein
VSAIRAASATYVQTALARDIDSWLAVSSEDAIFMPPNQARLETSQALREWNAASPPLTSLTVTPGEIVGRGDLAYVMGTWSLTAAPEGASPTTDSGSYIEIWRRDADGIWRINRDIWNSDQPLAQ